MRFVFVSVFLTMGLLARAGATSQPTTVQVIRAEHRGELQNLPSSGCILTLTYISPAETQNVIDLETFLQSHPVVTSSTPQFWLTTQWQPSIGVSRGVAIASEERLTLEAPARQSLATALTESLQLDPSISTDQREAKLNELRPQLDHLQESVTTLRAMINADTTNTQSLQDRITALRSQQHDLSDSLHAKKVRLAALESRLNEMRAQRDSAREDDDVIVELKKLAELQAKKLAWVQAQHKSGVASATDLADAEIAKAQAELQLAERRAAVISPGVMRSLDQIQEEMTKLSVDAAELKQQLSDVDAKLAPFDLSHATTQSLQNTVTALDAAKSGKANQLMDDLHHQIDDLNAQILRMEIVKIEPIPVAGQ